MAKRKSTRKSYVSFVLDETGSMFAIKEQTIAAFNKFVEGLKEQDEDILFTLTKFNSRKTSIVYDSVKITKVLPLNNDTYRPDHSTPLMDAIGKTILAMKAKIGRSKPKKVLIVIQTDGEENSSEEFSRQDIFNLREEMEDAGWTFVFLGADMDAYASSAEIGISSGNTKSFAGDEILYAIGGQTMRATTSYLSSETKGSTRTFFGDDEGDDLSS